MHQKENIFPTSYSYKISIHIPGPFARIYFSWNDTQKVVLSAVPNCFSSSFRRCHLGSTLVPRASASQSNKCCSAWFSRTDPYLLQSHSVSTMNAGPNVVRSSAALFIPHQNLTLGKCSSPGDFGRSWTSCQIRKIACCACAGNARNLFPPLRVSDPDMHHSTCLDACWDH